MRTFDVDDRTVAGVVDGQGRAHGVGVHPVPGRGGDDRLARAGHPRRARRAHGVVDELIVLDDRSTDDTAAVAGAAGATVVPIGDIHDRHGVGHGKGNALLGHAAASRGDFVVWCDGDVTSFRPTGSPTSSRRCSTTTRRARQGALRAPDARRRGRAHDRARRPAAAVAVPPRAHRPAPAAVRRVRRPPRGPRADPVRRGLGRGDRHARRPRPALRRGAIAQVDLGVRMHRHRTLHELSVQAAEVTARLLSRRGRPAAAARADADRADGRCSPSTSPSAPLASLRKRTDAVRCLRRRRAPRRRRSRRRAGLEHRGRLAPRLRRLARLGVAGGPPHPLRRARHVEVADAEVGERVDHGVLHRRRRADRAASPMPLAPSGLSGDGVSVERTSKLGSSAAVGMP